MFWYLEEEMAENICGMSKYFHLEHMPGWKYWRWEAIYSVHGVQNPWWRNIKHWICLSVMSYRRSGDITVGNGIISEKKECDDLNILWLKTFSSIEGTVHAFGYNYDLLLFKSPLHSPKIFVSTYSFIKGEGHELWVIVRTIKMKTLCSNWISLRYTKRLRIVEQWIKIGKKFGWKTVPFTVHRNIFPVHRL